MKRLAHSRTYLFLFVPLTCLAAAGCASPPLEEETTAIEPMGEVAAALEGGSPETQCGEDWDAQDVELYDGTLGVSQSFVNQHEMPVGYLPGECSGTLIARDLFLSAGHCTYQVGNTVRFNYQVDADTATTKAGDEFTVTEVIEQENNSSFDYALVRLHHAPGDRYGTARLSGRDLSGGELLTVIGHPAGVPKVVSTGPESGAADRGGNWFQHQADTLGGSSGSGVLDTAGRLIGIHTNGGCLSSAPPDADIEGNEALKISALLAHSPTLQNLGSDGLWWADGDNTYTKTSLSVSGHYVPFTGDFDGDGGDDVFWYGRGNGSDGIWWSNARTFDKEDAPNVGGLYVPFAGDFDGDGDDDIFWYGPEEKADYIWWSDGDRTFTSESVTVPGDYIPVAGDFDGDNDDDIFWYGRTTRADTLWWSSAGSFVAQSQTVSGDYYPIAGDFDGDNDDDIFWYGAGTRSDGIWWANGTSFNKVSTTVGGNYIPCVGNFDGDHGDDIFWYAPGSADDWVWSSNGTGGFTTIAETVSGQYHNVCGDFDHDGNTDIIWYGGPNMQ